MMRRYTLPVVVVCALGLAGLACTATVTPGPGHSSSVTLLGPLTNRIIPEGEALVFTFQTETDGQVSISVQANTDSAEPDFQVVRGEVEDLESTPIADLVVPAADVRTDGQATASFEPEGPEQAYTIFITDDAEEPDARFSITITQRK